MCWYTPIIPVALKAEVVESLRPDPSKVNEIPFQAQNKELGMWLK
jgi:hypothetical protein